MLFELLIKRQFPRLHHQNLFRAGKPEGFMKTLKKLLELRIDERAVGKVFTNPLKSPLLAFPAVRPNPVIDARQARAAATAHGTRLACPVRACPRTRCEKPRRFFLF